MHAHATTESEPHTFRIVRLPMVMRMTGLGRSTIYRMIAKQQFPGPVRLGDRAVAWRQDELDSWISSRPRTQ